MQTNETKLRQNLQVLLRCPEKFLQDFLQGILARHSCKGSSKGFLLWNSGTPNPESFETVEACNLGFLELWNF